MAKNSEKLTVARQHFDAGRFQQAEQECQRLLSGNPQCAEVLNLLGLVHTRGHELNRAVELLRQAVDLCPDNAVYHRNLGFACLNVGDIDQSIASSQRAIELSPGDVESLNNLAVALKQTGKLVEAAGCLREALRLRSDLAVLHRNLAEILLQQEEFNEAIVHYRQAVQLSPLDADILNGLGGALTRTDRYEEAIDTFQEALRIQPGHDLAQYNLATVLQTAGRPLDAISHFQMAVQLAPDVVIARIALGNLLLSEGQVEGAAEQYAAVLDLDASHVVAHNNLGSALTDLGRFDEAIRHLEDAQRLDPNYAASYYNLGDLAVQGRYQFSRGQLDRIQGMLEGGALPAETASILNFTLGGILDQENDYDAAFRCYQQANDEHLRGINAAGDRFDADAHRRMIDTILAVFDEAFFGKAFSEGEHTGKVDTELPVFVVGMPRSGSTLVEQMIASHPDAAGAGELEDIARLAREMPQLAGSSEAYPHCVPLAAPPTLNDLAARYLDRLQKMAPGALRVVDKQWHNYLHLGFIYLLFPQARVVHCRRDPVDLCLSCYFRRLEALNWTWNLTEIGIYFHHYQRLMDHWYRVLPNRIFAFSYEQLVKDPQKMCRELVDFCGLPWDEHCLRFHEIDRPIRTASRVQVRQPVYASSVGRWKNYSEYLTPLRRALVGET